MFPDKETSGGRTVAVIATRSNELKFVRPKPIHQSLFWSKDLGLFQFNEDFNYIRKKSLWYFYDQSCFNPVSLQAKDEIDQWLANNNRPHMTIEDLSKYVYKIRYVEEYERTLAQFVDGLRKQGATEKELWDGFKDGTLERAATEYTKSKFKYEAEKAFSTSDFSPHTIKWLNALFSEEVVTRNYLFQRVLTEQKFQLWNSLPIMGMFPNATMGKKQIALIVTDNRHIELDANIELKRDLATGKAFVHSKEYNDFEIQSPRAVYRHGRMRIYILMVWSPYAYERLPQAKPKVELTP